MQFIISMSFLKVGAVNFSEGRRHQNLECQKSGIVTDFQNFRLECTRKLGPASSEPEETGGDVAASCRHGSYSSSTGGPPICSFGTHASSK